MTTHMRFLPTAVLVAGLLLTACDGSEAEPAGPADPATTQVHVHFRDSSVPPEYHRSWDLTLDKDSIELVADSYGDVVAEESVKMPREEWEEFVAAVREDLDELGEPTAPQEGCTGGTGMDLEVNALDIDNCNSDGNEEMMAEIQEMLEQFTDLVHLEKHTRT